MGIGFRISVLWSYGLGFRVQGLGFRVEGGGLRDYRLGLKVEGPEFRV